MTRLILLSALIVAGCASNPASPSTPFARETTIARGKTTSIVEGVSVQFVAVSGDSRCPADAFCIQGGDAVVTLKVMSSGDSRSVELHTANAQPVTSGNLTIELLQLAPYPFSSRTIQPDEYQATIRVTR